MKPMSREEVLQILSTHDVVKIEMDKDGITYNLKPIHRHCLNDLHDAIYEDSVAHGLWESTDRYVRESIEENMRDNVPVDLEAMMRIWAMEIIRDEIYELNDSIGNAEAYTDELADVIIASLSVAGKLGIDIDAAVRRKMEINKARPWKHGKDENDSQKSCGTEYRR